MEGFHTGQTHTTIGNTTNNFGYLVEYLNYNSDGFKTLGNNLNTGFDINEISSKIRYKTSEDAKLKQVAELKFLSLIHI